MSGHSRLRVGGWVGGSDETSDDAVAHDLPADGDHLVIDAEPVGTVTEAWQPSRVPDPDAGLAGDDDAGPYRGRRRLIGERRSPARLRRVAIAAVAVGTLLVGTSAVVVGLRLADRQTQLAPPPSPDGVNGDADQERQGLDPSASPGPSPSPSPSPTDPPVQSFFEAESAELGSHAQVDRFDGAAGGQVVKLSGNPNGTFLVFPDVTVVDSGQYEVVIGYFAEHDRVGAVSVGGGSTAEVTFPGRGEGGGIGSITVSVQLASGANTIQVSSAGGAPLSIDGIVISG